MSVDRGGSVDSGVIVDRGGSVDQGRSVDRGGSVGGGSVNIDWSFEGVYGVVISLDNIISKCKTYLGISLILMVSRYTD